MIVSLPMYDFSEVRGALDTIWSAVRERLVHAGFPDPPRELVHAEALHTLWEDPDLLLSQCCGYDLCNRFADRLQPLATPRYTAPGCAGAQYSSVVLVGERTPATALEQLRGAVCVINGPESHSGMSALRALVAPLSRDGHFFGEVKVSGSHAQSIAVLARGEADVGAVDCVTYALIQRYRPDSVRGTRVLCYSEPAPGIPFVTRSDLDPGRYTLLQRAVLDAFQDPGVRSAAEELFIEGVEVLPASLYHDMREFERSAARHGYPALR